MFTFTIDDDAIDRIAANYTKNIEKNVTLALSDIRAQFRFQLIVEFARGNGGGWKPLSALYAKQKSKDYPGRPILVRTGAMRSAYLRETYMNPFDAEVVIPFPSDPQIRRRAMIHQNPSYAHQRQLPVDDVGYEEFERIALTSFRDAVRKSFNG